jgi:7-carboxy-7-deazaguanine synthase
MSNSTANMIEIFSSIQGEGMLVGLRQAFLRFHGCTMKCHYCDTRSTNTSKVPEFCQIEKTPGRQDFFSIRNPVSFEPIKDILEKWVCLVPHAHHSMSLTGGEPLLHKEFLKKYLPELREILPIYLETNGVLYTELSKCVDLLDYISMDFKLPSTTKSGSFWDEHQKFLEIAAQSNVYVKVVVSHETAVAEIRKACEIIASVNKDIPLILQPLTAITGNETISSLSLFELQEVASDLVKEVRIIPQTHKYLQLL